MDLLKKSLMHQMRGEKAKLFILSLNSMNYSFPRHDGKTIVLFKK